MRKALLFAAMFGGGLASRYQDTAPHSELPEMGRTEIRIMLSDRRWMPLGVMNASATLDVWPKGGSKFSVRLEAVCPHPSCDQPSNSAAQDPSRFPSVPGSLSCGEIRD